MPLRDPRLQLRPAAMALQCPEACTRRPGQMIRVDRAAQVAPALVAPAVLGNTARADPVDLLVDLVVPADLGITDLVVPADLGITDPVVPADLGITDPVVPADLGITDPVVPADLGITDPVVPAD